MEITFIRLSKPVSTLISSTGTNSDHMDHFRSILVHLGVIDGGSIEIEILKKPEKTPNILTNHVRFSSNISSTIPNAKYISILRDPVGHFVSTFEYFHHIGVFNSLDRGEKGLYQVSF